MPISKVQPMRPAEIKLVGLANTLESGLAQEITDRTNADTALQTNINNETAAREAADTVLQDNIDAEASTRAAADTALQTNINNETAAREAADTVLQGLIDAEAKLEFNTQADIELQPNTSSKISVTFTTEKGNEPVVMLSIMSNEADTSETFITCYAVVTSISTTGFSFRVYNSSADTAHTVSVAWVAVNN